MNRKNVFSLQNIAHLETQLPSLSWQIFNIFWLKLDIIYDSGENHHGNISLFIPMTGWGEGI